MCVGALVTVICSIRAFQIPATGARQGPVARPDPVSADVQERKRWVDVAAAVFSGVPTPQPERDDARYAPAGQRP